METMPDLIEVPLSGITFAESPFPHFSISEVFFKPKAKELLSWFEDTELWSLTKTNFYTQYEFSLIGQELPDSLHILTHEAILLHRADTLSHLFSKRLKVCDITAHKLIEGHKMGVHNDFIGSAETHRLVIQINDSWTEKNGGYLMLFNSKDPADVARIVRPLHNTAIGFEISDRSNHAVSAVHHFTRYTLVYTFNAAD